MNGKLTELLKLRFMTISKNKFFVIDRAGVIGIAAGVLLPLCWFIASLINPRGSLSNFMVLFSQGSPILIFIVIFLVALVLTKLSKTIKNKVISASFQDIILIILIILSAVLFFITLSADPLYFRA